ncbi:MAG: tetratricopeptide repeat protein, partial [Flavobacteriaceae bacterium]|nr:tetratricopeptide repeat protein [Flavobacteriaceae bacterium]
EPDSHTEFEANNLLGLNCLSIKDYDKAQEYFNKALKLARETELPGIFQAETVCLSNLGLVYQKQERHDEAIKYFDLALKYPNLFDENSSLYADVLDNLTYSKFKLNRKNGVPEDFYKALKIRESHQNYNGIVENLIRLSEYYQSERNTDSAVKYAVNAHDLARRTNILNLQLLTLRQLSAVIPEKSTEYSKEYIKLNDSLQNAERKAAERFARIEFETDEFKRQKERLAVQNRNILFFLVLISCIALLLYVIREQRSKNIQFRLKEAQQKANEEIYNLMLVRQQQLDEVVQKEKQRIARELHDGVLGRLFGTRINLDGLNNSDDEASKQSRENYINELKIIEQDIREISHELNRENLNIINNFVAILTNLLEEQKEVSQADLKYRIDSRIKWDKIDNNTKINVFRIIQEALQNINKYAEAKNIEIILNQEAETMMHLTISDDGVGFDTDRKAKGIGIKNMESRVKSCNGSFEIKSKKGKGTKISISLGF